MNHDETFDALVAICAPPVEPVRATGDWEAVEASLGMALPADFKRVTAAYGEGQFGELLHLLHPFTEGSSCLAACSASILNADRQLGDTHPGLGGRPLHPEPGGLFPFGRTDNGDVLYWVTAGPPDAWTVIVANPRAEGAFAFDGGCAAFLLGWLRGDVGCPLSPRQDECFEPRFDPQRDLLYVDVYFHFDGDPFEARVEALRHALGDARVRRTHLQESYSHAQLRADDDVARLQYADNARYGARLNLLVPVEHEGAWRARIAAVRDLLCWPIWRVSDSRGAPLWEELVDAGSPR